VGSEQRGGGGEDLLITQRDLSVGEIRHPKYLRVPL